MGHGTKGLPSLGVRLATWAEGEMFVLFVKYGSNILPSVPLGPASRSQGEI